MTLAEGIAVGLVDGRECLGPAREVTLIKGW
jgi:hypothetical protein